ncbi:aspartate/glutamate racemase family protein [Rhizobium leguminosarum]|uniref:Aspartate/glutamate racemase n=1 Tax=Rhizobium leguminosarum TaxID=384 RepID=A0A7X0DQB6_RHILE|nr:aspartate/glutamate racemase family protein [Rhizobium leguminosarum]MBB6219253.1 aspartate/glutamate racemase [Rhizobium leguminosarum]
MSIQTASASVRKLAFIHTVSDVVSEFRALAKEHLPDWKPFAILDESLLRNTIERGSLSHLTKRRLATYVWSAVDAGADAIVVTCSTLGPAVDAIAPLCPVPLFRIDEGMAKAAVEHGNCIGVLATLSTTLVPTADLLRRQAGEAGKNVVIDDVLVHGAFQFLADGNVEAHDAQIRRALEELSQKVDVIVFAQASMARAVQGMDQGLPVLTSPVLGIENVKRRLVAPKDQGGT